MQPKRDALDDRFIPSKYGGRGGFSYARKFKNETPYDFAGAIGNRSILVNNPTAHALNADRISRAAVRAKARSTVLKLLERIEQDSASMDEKALSGALTAAGRLAGVEQQSIQVKHSHRLIPVEQRAERASELLAKARLMLSNSSDQPYTPDVADAQVLDVQGDSTETQGTADPLTTGDDS